MARSLISFSHTLKYGRKLWITFLNSSKCYLNLWFDRTAILVKKKEYSTIDITGTFSRYLFRLSLHLLRRLLNDNVSHLIMCTFTYVGSSDVRFALRKDRNIYI